jgi:hypothetical protein
LIDAEAKKNVKYRFSFQTAEFRVLRGIFAVFLAFFAWTMTVPAGNALANPFEDTIGILENRTVFHWGRDCLIWIVHYPEELVDPWVEAEAGRSGMTDSEREEYRKGFVSELSIGSREPFLFNVYAFGPRPLDFSPFQEKVVLVTSDGERVKPVRYDQALDRPVSGIVQGLVFFPKQKDRNFAVAVQGMGVHDERLFSFGDAPGEMLSFSPGGALDAQTEEKESESEVIVLELPPKPAPQPARAAVPKEIERPPLPPSPPPPSAPPVPPAPAAPEIAIIEPEEQSMAEFVEAMRSGGANAAAPEKEAEVKAESAKTEQESTAGSDMPDSAYVSREKTVRDFLSLWTKNDPDAMYSMLSDSSRKLFSKETFTSDLRKAADFRAALRDGYTLEWLGTERARVTAVKRILLIRALVSRTLGVVREGSAWKIVW